MKSWNIPSGKNSEKERTPVKHQQMKGSLSEPINGVNMLGILNLITGSLDTCCTHEIFFYFRMKLHSLECFINNIPFKICFGLRFVCVGWCDKKAQFNLCHNPANTFKLEMRV
mmetsp:Transcript_22192/g.33878  ORF Transcript_22192/g.33878 Transcript_22192/m.33878 type:complete len:113 (+) Transcript_22192:2466-2804(+)